jgi:hypothetical protein
VDEVKDRTALEDAAYAAYTEAIRKLRDSYYKQHHAVTDAYLERVNEIRAQYPRDNGQADEAGEAASGES